MKKISLLFSLALILGTAQVSTMKRDASQITPSTNVAPQELWLPGEIITHIATDCDPTTRTSWSLVNKEYNRYASVRREDGKIWLNKEYRLYYLFYGCMHNLKNLVKNALNQFDPEHTHTYNWPDQTITTYPDKVLLNLAKHYIEELTQSDAAKLLPHYTDIQMAKGSSLDLAIKTTDEALLALLLKQPTINVNSLIWLNKSVLEYLLFQAFMHRSSTRAQATYLNMAKLLLRHPNRDLDRILPLLIQAARMPSTASLETIKHIFAQDNIDINAQDDKGRTTLHSIKCNDEHDTNVLTLVLTHSDINVNIQDNTGCTALHNTITQGYLGKIKLLLTHPDIKVNVQDYDGNTPLHDAIIYQDADIVTHLLAHPSIDLNIQNNDDHTPLSLAEAMHQQLVNEYSGWTTESSLDDDLLTQINEDQLKKIQKSTAIIEQLTLAHG